MTSVQADLRTQLATRFWNLAGKHRRDIRPFQSIGHELQAEMYALADEAVRLMDWERYQCLEAVAGGRHDAPRWAHEIHLGIRERDLTLPPTNWQP